MTADKDPASPRHRAWFAPLLCALFAAAVHLPVLRAGFVWDDLTVQRYQTPYFKSLGDAFRPPEGLAQWSENYYRPIVILTHMADERLNEALLGPAGFEPEVRGNPARARIPHAMTLLFHALAAAVVAVFARRCLAGRPGAETGVWAAGLVFALHPVHLEAASSVAGRSDSLAALFLVAALLATLRGRDRSSLPALAGGALLFLLALFAKESAAAGILLMPLCLALIPAEVGKEAGEERRAWPSVAAVVLFTGAAAAYAVFRLDAGVGTGAPTQADASLLVRAVAFYLGKLLVPWPHTPFVPELPGKAFTMAALAVGAMLAGAALRRRRRGDPFPLFCLLWIAAASLPPLAVAARDVAQAAVAERYLYLPSVGFALAAGGIVSAVTASRAERGRRAAMIIFAFILAGYAVASYAGASVWRSNLALWTHVTSQEGPSRHALGWTNLGTSLLEGGDLDAAERAFARASDPALAAAPDLRANAVNGLGMVSYRRAEAVCRLNRREEALRFLAEAEGYFSGAVMADPGMWGYWRNLAATRLLRMDIGASLTGRPDRELLARARRDIEEGLRVMPGNVEMLRLRSEHDAIARRWMGTH